MKFTDLNTTLVALEGADAGVYAPAPLALHHYACHGVDSGNTELPVSQVLYALAIANRCRTIVETGINNCAGATMWLAHAASINKGTYTGFDVDVRAARTAHALLKRVSPQLSGEIVHGDALVELPQRFALGSIDLLFIDDNHTRAHVEAEVAAFRPCMRPGGLMLFHDVLGVHEHDIWDVIQPLGGIKLVSHYHVAGHEFGGLGMLPC